jgi:hypothetical protein
MMNLMMCLQGMEIYFNYIEVKEMMGLGVIVNSTKRVGIVMTLIEIWAPFKIKKNLYFSRKKNLEAYLK